MTKKEAEKQLENHKKESLRFCPLTKSVCNPDCASYRRGRVERLLFATKGEYTFIEGGCRSPLVVGL